MAVYSFDLGDVIAVVKERDESRFEELPLLELREGNEGLIWVWRYLLKSVFWDQK